MVAAKKYIGTLSEALPQIRLLGRKYCNIEIRLAGSLDHQTHGLRDDQVLVKAWGKKKGGD